MSKIETLAKNISIIRNATSDFDFSHLDPRDALSIKEHLEWITNLCQVYIDFENGFSSANIGE